MSGTIISVIVILASQLLPMIGVEIGSEQLTNVISTITTIISGLVIWYKRTTLQHAPGNFGDVTAVGARK